jgi:hypothetical protein
MGGVRTDFPESKENWRAHSIQKLGANVGSSENITFEIIKA